uniref:Reverse transcriptase domain-containing protein n=1 Tax=Tanacetum cinerariifolium TaxID=118510 RepID=A0A6L2NAX5_TANCI|nr:reverse transcriptase domain-containing protein [Tanacetum cinerariifolium]
MNTRSSARDLFPPLDNPELTIRRRSRADPTLLNDFEMAAEGNGDLPVPDLQTMEELCQPSLNGRGGPISPIAIQATHFGLKNDSIKVNGVTDGALRLYLFPHSLIHHATAWFDRLPRYSINNFEQMAKMFLGKYFLPFIVMKLINEITNFRQRPDESLFEVWECYKLSIDRCPNHNMLPVTQIDTICNGLTLRHRDTINAAAGGTFMKRRPEECYDLIENMTAHHNDWDTSAQRNVKLVVVLTPSMIVQSPLAKLRIYMLREPIKVIPTNLKGNNQGRNQFFQGASHGQNPPPVYQAPAYQDPVYQALVHQPQIPQPQVVTTNEFTNFMKANDAILKNIQTNMTSFTNSNLKLKNMFGQFMKMNTASPSSSGTLPGNTITNPKEELKGITTRSGTTYQGPMIPTTSSSLPLVVECETEATKDTVHLTINGSTKDVQPPVVQTESPILSSELVIAPIIEPDVAPVSTPKPNQRPSIPYPSRLHDQNLRDKANDQREKFFQIFKDLNFNISFVDALILMPKFSPTIKTLLTNEDKLSKPARNPLNEHCSVVLLKKLPEKLGDPGKFLIPCDFLGMNKLSLPDLSPTCMTRDLSDHSISHPIGVTEYIFIKVGTFYFPADFAVIDFDDDPRVPLILERSFLKTGRALIDVFEGELTLCVGKEAITFNLDQTSRYSSNYNDMTANRIDVINMACEEYSQEVLDFSDVIASGNPTSYYDPIVSTTSPTLTPFGNINFLLKEVDAFLALEDNPTLPEVDQSYVDTEGDILLLEAYLNDDPSLPPPNQGNYLPQVRKELKICEAKIDKSSIDEPSEVELKDLPPHLEYAFLEGDDKLPVINAKDLSIEEKTALITILKSHQRATTWKLSDIKGTDPEFCTHKILMEDDFEPGVQHQRRVNHKIHDVINNEVLKLLDAGLIYSISDSPWVSLIHCVPKKGGFTVLENEENELILTRLVMGWRVCIDYRYFQIPIDLKDQEKTNFTFPYGTFAYRRMPFGLCNAPGTFQRCMMAIFHVMIEKTIEVFMDDFSVFWNSFRTCLSHLEKILKHCEDTNLFLNWEKSHFMVKEGIVLGHKISKNGIEVV